MGFNLASADEIRSGLVTDVYFTRIAEVLKAKGVDADVVGEVRAAALPRGWDWAVLAGLDEVQELFSGMAVTVRAMPEGTVFGAEEPVITVSGGYRSFAAYETALLGLVCQASGVATMAARCSLAAERKPVYSFGARRMHPALAPMIDRNAYLGGCDGVAVALSAERLGVEPVGTMAHAFILVMGDPCAAYRAFDEVLDPSIPRVALVDTLEDEKFGAITAAECLGERLAGVRLDTPRSRRGDMLALVGEVRWELGLRGFGDVWVIVSGGLDEHEIARLAGVADAFGVGTAISNAPVVDFSFDLVEVNGMPSAKRGKRSGQKQVWECPACRTRDVLSVSAPAPTCSCTAIPMEPLLMPLVDPEAGALAREDVDACRSRLEDTLATGRFAL